VLLALGLTIAVLVWLLSAPAGPPPVENGGLQKPPEAVEVIGPSLIRIRGDSKLNEKLQIIEARSVEMREPVLSVTGTVIASMRPGTDKGKDYWQFNTPELLTTYSDWDKAVADITFTEAQLIRVKELAEERLKSQTEVVDRLRKLVAAGTDSIKDLRTEETNLRQFRITGAKEVHEAETAVKVAHRNEAALARQLQQSGLETELLRKATKDDDLVVADVPEAKLSRVHVGQSCTARFFGLGNDLFEGKVYSLSPVLSKERRTLRVLFKLDDPKDRLRPGMFAEIGLGTDPRRLLRVPADSVVHVGRFDYVLVRSDTDSWRVATVELGEALGQDVEVLKGIKPGDRVLGKGAILLKPFIITALQTKAKEEVR